MHKDKRELIDAAIAEARRQMPDDLVLDVEWQPYTDSLGDEALRVIVVVTDKAARAEQLYEQFKPIDQALSVALRARDVDEFPYLRFLTRSDREAERSPR
jgi:hypothetical protein